MRAFKVETKRSDKKFPLKSPEISAEVGAALLDAYPNLHVDVHNPDVTVRVEIRDFGAYVHGEPEQGAGGIPVGTGGKAALLISGGIDSPVAAWMMAKRGVELTPVHFASPPYTSERAEQKVADLLRRVAAYAGRMYMITVPFARVQEEILDKCPEEYFTILMRRFMMRISAEIAKIEGCAALITGEKLGPGGQPDDAGHRRDGRSLPPACVPPAHRHGQERDCFNLAQNRHLRSLRPPL